MTAVLLPFLPQRDLARALADRLLAPLGCLEWWRFPDGESQVTLDDGRTIRNTSGVVSTPPRTGWSVR